MLHLVEVRQTEVSVRHLHLEVLVALVLQAEEVAVRAEVLVRVQEVVVLKSDRA